MMRWRLLGAGVVLAAGAVPSPLAAQQAAAGGDSAASAPVPHRIPTVGETLGAAGTPLLVDASGNAAVSDTGGRPRAVFYGNGYGVRLRIHLIASYAELPLFAAEYVLGQRLITVERTSLTRPHGLRTAHQMVAEGLGALFAINTVTGVWNLWDARHDPNGRFVRTLHGLTMLAADAGFLWAAQTARGARRTDAGAVQHRNIAIGSMSLATASTLMMWLWKH